MHTQVAQNFSTGLQHSLDMEFPNPQAAENAFPIEEHVPLPKGAEKLFGDFICPAFTRHQAASAGDTFVVHKT